MTVLLSISSRGPVGTMVSIPRPLRLKAGYQLVRWVMVDFFTVDSYVYPALVEEAGGLYVVQFLKKHSTVSANLSLVQNAYVAVSYELTDA